MEYKLLIKEYRILRGVTQRELAEKSKVKQAYICQLENDSVNHKSPTLRVMFRLATALDVCPHILVRYNTNCEQNCFDVCNQKFLPKK